MKQNEFSGTIAEQEAKRVKSYNSYTEHRNRLDAKKDKVGRKFWWAGGLTSLAAFGAPALISLATETVWIATLSLSTFPVVLCFIVADEKSSKRFEAKNAYVDTSGALSEYDLKQHKKQWIEEHGFTVSKAIEESSEFFSYVRRDDQDFMEVLTLQDTQTKALKTVAIVKEKGEYVLRDSLGKLIEPKNSKKLILATH